MATYEIKTITVTTTSQVVVAADSDVDRRVHIAAGSISVVNWSFDGSSAAKIVTGSGIQTSFVLPADEELSAWVDSGQNSVAIGLIVTKA